jgi:hypothetical protein
MDIQELIVAFGGYYEAAGQNAARVKRLLTQGIETPAICTPIKTDDTIFRLGQLHMTSIVQPFQLGWTPINSAAFTPNELRLYQFKVDQDIQPDVISASWLGFLEANSLTKKDFPLVKYLIENNLIPSIQQDMELAVYGHGVYKAPTPGAAGAAKDCMNGLIKLLQTGVDAETINTVPLGALDKDTIFDQVEAFIDGISEVYQGVPMDVCMSQAWFKHYLRDKRASGYYQKFSDKDIDNTIDFTPQKVKALPSLNSSNVIFATPKANLLHLTKKSANMTKFDIQESKRTVSMLTDWWEGLGFGMDAAVWTNMPKSGSGSY